MNSWTRIALVGLAATLLPANGFAQTLSDLRESLQAELASAGETGPAAVAIVEGETYTPGAIYCTDGQRGSKVAFAGTLADQPIFRIDVFGEGSEENTARFDFEGENDQIVWQLQEGDIGRDGPTFEAIGYAHALHQEIEDGLVVETTPIPEKEREPVAAVIRCE